MDNDLSGCRPKLGDSFLLTRRFWFSWAVPGVMLLVWLAGVLFRLGVAFERHTPSSPTAYYLSMWDGNAVLTTRPLSLLANPVSNEWKYLHSTFEWHPGVELFPRLYSEELVAKVMGGTTQDRVVKFPVWPPFVLWLIGMLLWEGRQRRKQATQNPDE